MQTRPHHDAKTLANKLVLSTGMSYHQAYDLMLDGYDFLEVKEFYQEEYSPSNSHHNGSSTI